MHFPKLRVNVLYCEPCYRKSIHFDLKEPKRKEIHVKAK